MINIAKILKNAPKGLELYSLVHGEVTLEKVIDSNATNYPIVVLNSDTDDVTFTKYGKFSNKYHNTECVLFPSKEHKSWNNWQEILFQRGDVITVSGNQLLLFSHTHHAFTNEAVPTVITTNTYRYATPEEHEQFFKELNDNGYTWNEETKQIKKIKQTIEKYYTPKYKIGDWVESLGMGITQIIGITNNYYNFSNNKLCNIFAFDNDTSSCLAETPLKEKPFTIDMFKPFDKVLVKYDSYSKWGIDFFERYDYDSINNTPGPYICLSSNTHYCIPYNSETAHLLGTTDDAPDKYKTW